MKPDYLTIPSLDKWQHYKDRCPPWIKLHRDMLNDYKFSCLPDASKAHLLSIWLLASQMDNEIPNDVDWIAKKINATDKVDIKLLIDSGFILLVQDASKPIAKSKQSALVETEEEAEAKTESSPSGLTPERPPCPHTDVIKKYHEILPELPIVRVWNDKRKKYLRTRWNEDQDRQNITYWENLFKYVRKCPFLMGENDRQWTPDLEWIVNSSNFVKIIEGKYERK